MMNSKTSATVSLASLIVLISGCATDPLPPSLPSPQFIVIVKGETGPLNKFQELIGKELSIKLEGCSPIVAPSPQEGVPKSDASGQLAYQCNPKGKSVANEQLKFFAEAYGNSTASLLEMKITTASSCIARTCYGGPLRLWYSSPPCRYPC